MAADAGGCQPWLLGLLAACVLACNNVDIAGTLVGQAGNDQGSPWAAAGSSGAWASDRHEPAGGGASGAPSVGGSNPSDGDRDRSRDTEAEPQSAGLSCREGSEWLLFIRTDLVTLAGREQSEIALDAAQMLYVDQDCTFWVLDSSRSDQMRTGGLDSAEAQQLWMDLGTDARAQLPRDEATSGIGPVWMIQDSKDQLACLGDCISERVDAGVRRLFELAGQWVTDLYARGELFEGSVDDIGLPVE